MDENKKMILWGAQSQALVIKEITDEDSIKIISLFDDNPSLESPLKHIPLYYGKEGFYKWKQSFPGNNIFFCVSIGNDLGIIRHSISNFLISEGLQPYSIKHKTSYVSPTSKVGTGCQILAGSVIGAHATIEDYTIINTSASIDHECLIKTGAHIGPGAILSGKVTISRYSFIGSGAVILPNITIGENCIIGAGSVVTKSIPDNVVVYGNPAKIIRVNNKTHE